MSVGFLNVQAYEIQVQGDWPFDVAGPEEPCPCGCPRFKRLDDGGWRCEGCGEVAYEDCPAPCEGREAVLTNQTAEDMEWDAAMAFGYDEQEI